MESAVFDVPLDDCCEEDCRADDCCEEDCELDVRLESSDTAVRFRWWEGDVTSGMDMVVLGMGGGRPLEDTGGGLSSLEATTSTAWSSVSMRSSGLLSVDASSVSASGGSGWVPGGRNRRWIEPSAESISVLGLLGGVAVESGWVGAGPAASIAVEAAARRRAAFSSV